MRKESSNCRACPICATAPRSDGLIGSLDTTFAGNLFVRRYNLTYCTCKALVYLDPMIGTLRHYRDQLFVCVNSQENRLELHHRGETLEHFSLTEGVRRACEAALGAYFNFVETLARRSREALAA